MFEWKGFDEVLSRIWHCTHVVRNIVGGSRNLRPTLSE